MLTLLHHIKTHLRDTVYQMPTSEFVLQGLTATTHDRVLVRLFDIPEIQRVLVSVAYVTESGVARIEDRLRLDGARTTVFAGAGNGSTTYQGLARLHNMVSELYAVDTRSPSATFHPKLYLTRGISRARLVIGSANLTSGGLSGNIEAGMLLDFDLSDADDRAIVDSIEAPFDESVTNYPDHFVKINSLVDLDQMLAARRLVDERKPRNADGNSDQDEAGGTPCEGHNIPPIKLKTSPLRVGGLSAFGRRPAESTKHTNALLSNGVVASPDIASQPKVDAERESSVTHYLKRRAGEGPRARARRAKDEAKVLYKKWYYTGDPCRYGHYSDRLVSNGKCRECNRLDSERSNRLGLYR